MISRRALLAGIATTAVFHGDPPMDWSPSPSRTGRILLDGVPRVISGVEGGRAIHIYAAGKHDITMKHDITISISPGSSLLLEPNERGDWDIVAYVPPPPAVER